MPARTTHTAPAEGTAPGPSKPRRTVISVPTAPPDPVFPEDAMDIDADENDSSRAGGGPLHLDDPWAYTFQPNDRVWIRNHDKWIAGRVFPRSVPKIGSRDSLTYWNILYQDAFGHKLRRYFAPLLGELKPDSARVRQMLREAHWI
ncbi:hypothetical protein GGX14DRAFT_557851 [Mycena pura]|uniref:Uncharacterized protein n=1 Tax=Mycena pura TaxID=153505 RepID=A0AAD6YLS9_9AGAR|nr:hypothetical protein GGX14DRAFT_557851 [Mycena pura]